MKIAKKPKKKNQVNYMKAKDSIEFAQKQEEAAIANVTASAYIAMAYTLSGPPYMWKKDKVMRFKRIFDRYFTTALRGSNYHPLEKTLEEEFDINIEELFTVDKANFQAYFGKGKFREWFGYNVDKEGNKL